jgi:hypothetical protein
MKNAVMLSCLLIVVCCGGKDRIESQMAGTYTRKYIDSYRESYDTLIIHKLTNTGSEGYVVEERSQVYRIKNKKKIQPQFKNMYRIGQYDEASRTLLLTPGVAVFFDLDADEAIIGKQHYKKRNN